MGIFSRAKNRASNPRSGSGSDGTTTDQGSGDGSTTTILEALGGTEEAPSSEHVDPWADPPAIDLGAAETIVRDGHTAMTDEQALALLARRLGRGIAYMGGRVDVPLVAHTDRDHDAWSWVDQRLLQDTPPASADDAPALHVALRPLLGRVDAAEVNPLRPDGRRRHPSIPGGLAHVAAHLRFTRIDQGLMSVEPWAVRCAALALEEVRCEARQVRERPQDAPYLRASALLWSLPEGRDPRWRTAYLALMTLGRQAAGVLRASDVRGVQAPFEAVFSSRERRGLMGVWARAVRLGDGDTQGLIGLARELVAVVSPRMEWEVFADPCAARSWHMEAPRPDEGGGDDGDAVGEGLSAVGEGMDAAGSGDGGGAGDEGGGMAEGWGGAGGGTGSGAGGCGDGEIDDDAGDGGGDESGRGGATMPGAGLMADLEWDDPLARALGRVAELANSGARQELIERARQEREREEVVRSITAPLSDADRAARERERIASDVFGRDGRGRLLMRVRCGYRPPSEGELRLVRELMSGLRRVRFRERGRVDVGFREPPGRLVGRELMQVRAQRAMGQLPTARPFRRRVYSATPSPMIHLGVLVDVSASMKWAAGPVGAMTWALSQAVTGLQGRVGALTFGVRTSVLAEPGVMLREVPLLRSKDNLEGFTHAVRAIEGRMGMAMARGARCLFVISDGAFTKNEMESGAAELERLVRAGVKVVWIRLGSGLRLPDGRVVDPLSMWLPEGVGVASIRSIGDAPRRIVEVMRGVVLSHAARTDAEGVLHDRRLNGRHRGVRAHR